VLTGITGASYPLPGLNVWQFHWGTTSAFGQSTDFQQEITDNAEHAVSAQLTGLTPSTTYHYRLESLAAQVFLDPYSRPDDVTFTTPPAVAPTASPPIARIAPGTVEARAVPVQLSWATHAGTYPSCHSTIRQSIGGGAFTATPQQPAGKATTLALRLAPRPDGRRFQVRASDCHGTVGDWTTGVGSTVIAVQDAATTRTGMWRRVTGSKLWGGSAMSTSSLGATARFKVTARSIGLVAGRGPAGGAARIYVDGALVATVNLHAASAQQRQVVFARSWTSAGAHTITVVAARSASGSTITLDGLAGIR
jgi:hypothetical protein